ncbi:hypothetical protein PanWU01x14_256490 [Parasponia andersonii]|uniref:Uncharacterized protein n=1 Tax=Parasponia andersonii TaxID=3476 RepID=A0A2P5BAG2_PARAD|nr:hypothetical protein PanWU01x14_256490 [Parasponia andersonii]
MGPPESNQIDESRVWVGSGLDSGGVLGNGYAKILAESSAGRRRRRRRDQSSSIPFFLSVLNFRSLSRACVFTPLRISSSIVPIPMSQSARSTTLHNERQNLVSLGSRSW